MPLREICGTILRRQSKLNGWGVKTRKASIHLVCVVVSFSSDGERTQLISSAGHDFRVERTFVHGTRNVDKDADDGAQIVVVALLHDDLVDLGTILNSNTLGISR